MTTLAMFNRPLPVLVRVTVLTALGVLIAWLPKERDVGERLAVVPTAVPVKATDCGLPTALSVMLMVADFAPVEVGEKVTLTVHAAPAAKVVPQVWLLTN